MMDNIFSDFCLSRHNRSDTPQLVKHLSNPSIANNLKHPPFPYTEANAKEWHDFLDNEKESRPQTARFRWAIRQCSSSELIGDVSLEEWDELGTYRLGYWLAEDYWGKGIMSNTVGQALNIARGHVSKIVADVKEENWGSRRVLEKNGFKYIGNDEATKGEEVFGIWKFELEIK